MQQMSAATTILTLVIGASGALVAIYLKEAVQQAHQRRILAWQLFAYLLVLKKEIVRYPMMLALYEKVKSRETDLRVSLSKGTEAFSIKLQEQSSARTRILDEIRTEVIAAFSISNAESKTLRRPLSVLSLLRDQFSQQRKDLIDSKTFMSDRDAAQLGRVVALNVVRMRGALQTVLAAMEILPTAFHSEEEGREYLIAHLTDMLVFQGEAFLESLVMLERIMERISKRKVLLLTWDVLTKE